MKKRRPLCILTVAIAAILLTISPAHALVEPVTITLVGAAIISTAALAIQAFNGTPPADEIAESMPTESRRMAGGGEKPVR